MQRFRHFSLPRLQYCSRYCTVAEQPSHLFVRFSGRALVVEPNLDFEERLRQKDKLRDLLRKRGRPEQDLDTLNSRYMHWKELTKRHELLEKQQITLQQEAALEKRQTQTDAHKTVLKEQK